MSLKNFYFTDSWKIGIILAIKRILGCTLDNTIMQIDHLLAGKNKSIYSITGEKFENPPSEKVAIIATHILTAKAIINIIFAIADLLADGFHVYIIDTGHLQFTTKNLNITILKRNNVARDFGSFRDVLARLDLGMANELILMNDSCFWSENSMSKYLNEQSREFRDIRCITLSFQRVPHPQSYFLHIKASRIRLIQDFFRNEVRDWRFKRNIITRGEIKLARVLNDSGCEVIDVFGGNNSLYLTKKQKYLNILSINTMVTNSCEVFNSIGVVKVSQKHLVHPHLAFDSIVPPEQATLFYVS